MPRAPIVVPYQHPWEGSLRLGARSEQVNDVAACGKGTST